MSVWSVKFCLSCEALNFFKVGLSKKISKSASSSNLENFEFCELQIFVCYICKNVCDIKLMFQLPEKKFEDAKIWSRLNRSSVTNDQIELVGYWSSVQSCRCFMVKFKWSTPLPLMATVKDTTCQGGEMERIYFYVGKF